MYLVDYFAYFIFLFIICESGWSNEWERKNAYHAFSLLRSILLHSVHIGMRIDTLVQLLSFLFCTFGNLHIPTARLNDQA